MELSGERLYISGKIKDQHSILCPIESTIVLFVLNYCKNNEIYCCIVSRNDESDTGGMQCISKSSFPNVELLSEPPVDVSRCTLPAIQRTCMIRTGLCAVLRHIIKISDKKYPHSGLLKLLGYKGICLKSCAEVSVWTKFCEIEMLQCIKSSGKNSEIEHTLPDIPKELRKLENHLGQPAIIPNISKRKRQIAKQNKNQNVQEAEEKTSEQGTLEHIYAEGTNMTLTDLILYPCVTCYLERCKNNLIALKRDIPRVVAWYERMQRQALIKQTGILVDLPWIDLSQAGSTNITDRIPEQSDLDVRDPNKKKFKAHSEQVENILAKLERCGIKYSEEAHPCDGNLKLTWESMPLEVHPAQGELPGKRVARKCEQLENLARAVMHIARAGHVIVDFCSGGGHLGIVLAHLLPDCKIILVENKEESIMRAEKRIQALGLDNIVLYQCNMDYFIGTFDIGICLHACGVATDLVLQRCLDHCAAFVICPCCYGAIQNTHTHTYPRSATFINRGITDEDYLILGHAADQTQVGIKQAADGKTCMLLIDTDRAESAREKGYHVTLCSLQPLSCSPKNDLLIGVLNS